MKKILEIFIFASITICSGQAANTKEIKRHADSNLAPVSKCETPQFSKDVSVCGNYLYVADSREGLVIIDIKNISNPKIIGSCRIPIEATAIEADSGIAYIAEYYSGLVVVDVKDPANPHEVKRIKIPGFERKANSITKSGSYIYITDGDLWVADMNDTNQLKLSQLAKACDLAKEVGIPENWVYLGHSDSWKKENNDPYIFSHGCKTPGFSRQIAVMGDYGYIADGMSGLTIVDLKNPLEPKVMDTCDTPGYASGIDVRDGYAYIADLDSGVTIIDIHNPLLPKIVGRYSKLAGETFNVAISQKYLYVGNWEKLAVININNPQKPFLVASYTSTQSYKSIKLAGEYIFVTDGDVQILKALK